jgi:hypothetical protein
MDIGMSKIQKRSTKVSGENKLTYREHFSTRGLTVVDNTNHHRRHHHQHHQRFCFTT